MDSPSTPSETSTQQEGGIKNILPNLIWKQLPLLFLRILGILFSIIVFGCISDQIGTSPRCPLCNFLVAVGVIAFLFCLAFLAKDIMMIIVEIRGQELSKAIKLAPAIADGVANGVLALLWFAAFCYAANEVRVIQASGFFTVQHCVNVGVAFSFFSIIVSSFQQYAMQVAIVGVNGLILLTILGVVKLPGFMTAKSEATIGEGAKAPGVANGHA